MEILTKANLVGAKNCSHCSFQDCHSLTKRNQVSLVRIHFSHPESDGKLSDVGWKATKEYLNHRGTKVRLFRVCFRAPFLPPFSTLRPLLPPPPPPLSPIFRLPENSDLGAPMIWVLFIGDREPRTIPTKTFLIRWYFFGGGGVRIVGT